MAAFATRSNASLPSGHASRRQRLLGMAALVALALCLLAATVTRADDEDDEEGEEEAAAPMPFVDFGNPEFQPQNPDHPRFDAACRVVTHALGRPIGGFVEECEGGEEGEDGEIGVGNNCVDHRDGDHSGLFVKIVLREDPDSSNENFQRSHCICCGA